MENLKKYILPSLLFLGLAFLVIIFYIFKTDVIKTLHNPFDVSRYRLDTCQFDSDCIVVDSQDCCFGKKAINKKYLKQYKRTPEWQTTEEDCRFANCPWTDLNEEPKCVMLEDTSKRCVLSREPEAGPYLDRCLAKYNFINDNCEENCNSEEIYAFYVGDGGRFEEIMDDTSYLAKDYKEVLPEDIKKKVVAVYEKSDCENCEEKFSIRESTALSYVGINSFCYFLDTQNRTCKDCIKFEKIEKNQNE